MFLQFRRQRSQLIHPQLRPLWTKCTLLTISQLPLHSHLHPLLQNGSLQILSLNPNKNQLVPQQVHLKLLRPLLLLLAEQLRSQIHQQTQSINQSSRELTHVQIRTAQRRNGRNHQRRSRNEGKKMEIPSERLVQNLRTWRTMRVRTQLHTKNDDHLLWKQKQIQKKQIVQPSPPLLFPQNQLPQ